MTAPSPCPRIAAASLAIPRTSPPKVARDGSRSRATHRPPPAAAALVGLLDVGAAALALPRVPPARRARAAVEPVAVDDAAGTTARTSAASGPRGSTARTSSGTQCSASSVSTASSPLGLPPGPCRPATPHHSFWLSGKGPPPMDKPTPKVRSTTVHVPTTTVTEELQAVFEIGKALRPLTPESRRRVLAKVRADLLRSPPRRAS